MPLDDELEDDATPNTTDPAGPRYPGIQVQLTGQDGNAFYILGAVQKAMRKAGISQEERDEYRKAATAGSYDNLLRVTMRWVTVL